ncbi:MAG: fibronectin type III domain-containing protein [Planctomycetaceae bacterium]|nr:fibronectin type III domain-containing protein [Planctomycetaceae bacterium]
MPTKKKSKKVQSSKRKVQSKSGVRSFAAMEAQIAELQEQIAALQAQSAESRAQSKEQIAESRVESQRREQSSESREQSKREVQSQDGNQNHSAFCTLHSALHSALPKVGPPLATPVIDNVTPVGSSFMRVSWTPVTNASGYVIRYSTDETFATNMNTVSVDETTAEVTLDGLQANTTYYISVKATGTGIYLDSPFSVAMSAMTGIVSNGDTVTHLQSWLAGQQSMFQDFSTLLPQLDSTVLTPAERRRLNGSGVRRYGFIDKVSDVSADYPQFWPAAVSGASGSVDFQDRLKERLREIEVLRNLLVWSNYVARVVRDLLLIASDDAFRMANTYYATVRTAARRQLPEAAQVFQMIDLFWRRPRRTTEEPTIPEVERDLRALLRGTKDGEIIVRNESDQIVKGERVIIDNTMKAQSSKFKVQSEGEAE